MIGLALAAFALGGLAGWAVENVATGPATTYSNVFGGRKVPFLPVFGFGAAAVVLAAPVMLRRGWSLPKRLGAYAVGAAGLEFVAGVIDRRLGPPTWDYGGGRTVDVPHTAAFAGMALVLEQVAAHVKVRSRATVGERA